MNNNYLNNNQNMKYTQQYIPNEQSYLENILRLNKGKRVCIYQSFSESNEWKDKAFPGIIEQCGKDHIILSDPNTGNWFMLLTKYLDYIEFSEEINSAKQFYSSIN